MLTLSILALDKQVAHRYYTTIKDDRNFPSSTLSRVKHPPLLYCWRLAFTPDFFVYKRVVVLANSLIINFAVTDLSSVLSSIL